MLEEDLVVLSHVVLAVLDMHLVLEAEVLEAPQVRYTQDNQTPVAEMAVRISPRSTGAVR